MTELQATPVKPRHRGLQNGLQSLLVFMTLCAIPCSWIAIRIQQVKKQRAAVAKLIDYPSLVHYDWDVAGKHEWPGPRWIRQILGNDFFAEIEEVWLYDEQVTDSTLEYLEDFPKLKVLRLSDTRITDAGMQHVARLHQLENLDLIDAPITDSGVANLESLSQLKILDLAGTQITDAGLQHLRALRHLSVLELGRIRVTSEGVQRLREALPNCEINK